MTDKQKESIALLRDSGVSVTEIAERLGLSVNTIKSYCKRHALKAQTKSKRYCLQCHNLIRQNLHRKAKKFCCDQCRHRWWTAHSDLIHRVSLVNHTCPVCGKSFLDYKSKQRIYCSRSCFIWHDRSRSESWTPEMKAVAGQKTRERSKKCPK